MPSPGFEPGSPQPQSKYGDLDCLAMGHASKSGFLVFIIELRLDRGHRLLRFTSRMNLESVPCFAEIWSTYNPSQWRVEGGRAVWSTTPWTRKSAVQISLRSWIITFHLHFHELDNPSFLRRQESYDEKKMERKRQDSSSTSNGAIKTTCI